MEWLKLMLPEQGADWGGTSQAPPMLEFEPP